MKNLIILGSLLLLVGCGGSSSSDDNSSQDNEVTIKQTIMQIGKIYEVSSGDKIYRDTNNTKLEITYRDKTNITSIELLEGNATITYHESH